MRIKYIAPLLQKGYSNFRLYTDGEGDNNDALQKERKKKRVKN